MKGYQTIRGGIQDHAKHAARAVETLKGNLKARQKGGPAKSSPETVEYLCRLFSALLQRVYAKRASENLSIRAMCHELDCSTGHAWRFMAGEAPGFSMRIFVEWCLWLKVSPSQIMKEAEVFVDCTGTSEEQIIAKLEEALFALKMRRAVSEA